MQSHSDGPSMGGGHRFAGDAWRSGVPRGWALGQASPAERERIDARKAAELLEKTAGDYLLAIVRKFPVLEERVVAARLGGASCAAIMRNDQFRLLVEEQHRRTAALAEFLASEKA